jgi:hypothetical protein
MKTTRVRLSDPLTRRIENLRSELDARYAHGIERPVGKASFDTRRMTDAQFLAYLIGQGVISLVYDLDAPRREH